MLVHTESAASDLEQETKEKGANDDEKHIKTNPDWRLQRQKTPKQLWWRPQGGTRLVAVPLLLGWAQAEAADIGGGQVEHITREKA